MNRTQLGRVSCVVAIAAAVTCLALYTRKGLQSSDRLPSDRLRCDVLFSATKDDVTIILCEIRAFPQRSPYASGNGGRQHSLHVVRMVGTNVADHQEVLLPSPMRDMFSSSDSLAFYDDHLFVVCNNGKMIAQYVWMDDGWKFIMREPYPAWFEAASRDHAKTVSEHLLDISYASGWDVVSHQENNSVYNLAVPCSIDVQFEPLGADSYEVVFEVVTESKFKRLTVFAGLSSKDPRP